MDRPVAPSPSSTVSLAVRRKPFSRPVLLERSDRRAPLASLTMVAVTPAPAALILSRILDRLVSPAPMLMVTALLPALPVKVLPLQEPNSIVNDASLRVDEELARAVLVPVWAAASDCTVTS